MVSIQLEREEMKRMFLLTILILGCLQGQSENLVIINGEDDVSSKKVVNPQKSDERTKSTVTTGVFTPAYEQIMIISGPSLASSNTAQFRANVMAGLLGGNVEKDRLNKPAAYHVIPEISDTSAYANGEGLQWSDLVTTTFNTWMGRTNPNYGEYGMRLVISVCGVGKPGQYECEIASTIPGITSARFYVATNSSSGAELVFGPQYVGVNFGPNQAMDSVPDSITGRLVKGGDDTVYDNGQRPSQVDVDWWDRFGATAVVTCTSLENMRDMQNAFARSIQTFSARLYKNGKQVSKYDVQTARPRMIFQRSGHDMAIRLIGGQHTATYKIQWSPSIQPANWTQFPETSSSQERLFLIPILQWPTYFYRAYQE